MRKAGPDLSGGRETELERGICLCVALLTLTGPLTASAGDKPNILWIIAEDIGPDLGCYEVPAARTPNLDRLAAEGRLYRHAYSTAPVCSAARSALITGMYQTAIGAHHHRSHRTDGYRLTPDVKTIMDRLRPAGYHTANIRHFPVGVPLKCGGKTDWNFQVEGNPFDTDRWGVLKEQQPFFAQVNFFETHRVYKPARRDPTDPAQVCLPPYLANVPEHRATRERLRAELDRWITQTANQGALPEDPAVRAMELQSNEDAVQKLEERWKP